MMRVFAIIRYIARSSFEVDQIPSAFMQLVVHFVLEISHFYFCLVERMHALTIDSTGEYIPKEV